MKDLKDKVIVITGALGIQGPEHKKAFEEYGAKVITTDTTGGDFKMDVTDKNLVKKVVDRIVEQQGKIDVWVNNAGATGKQGKMDWDHILKVNLTGTYIGSKAAAETMSQTGGGSIINIASIYGLVGPNFDLYKKVKYAGKPMGVPTAYSASKGGVIALTYHLASLWADKNIRVNCVTPGGIFDNQDKEFVKRYSKLVPMGRMANKGEISGALLYLASDLSSYTTGANIVVDGGLTSRA